MPIGVTPLILTFNESPNIARTLARLSWANDIVVVDSGSSDDTREIAAAYPGVRVFQRPFTTHAEQWNFGLSETAIATEWVLALDADFILSDQLIREIGALNPEPSTGGYWATFDYCIDGQPLRGAAYPPVMVLYRRAAATYEQDGHTQRVRVAGGAKTLSARMRHDDRKPLTHWLASQIRYMRLEAEKLSSSPATALTAIDRIRRWGVVMPPAMFAYCYLFRGGILDGRRGLFYALQRAAAELILSLFLVERRLKGHGKSRDVA